MIYFLLTIEFIAATLLTITVLLHTAKGEGLGSIGGTARIFGSQKSLESGLDKITIACATVFMISAALVYFLS